MSKNLKRDWNNLNKPLILNKKWNNNIKMEEKR